MNAETKDATTSAFFFSCEFQELNSDHQTCTADISTGRAIFLVSVSSFNTESLGVPECGKPFQVCFGLSRLSVFSFIASGSSFLLFSNYQLS